MQKAPYQLLLGYSFRLLTRRNYTEAEILDKLIKRGKKVKFENYEVLARKAVERLKEIGFINDKKYFADYFEYRLAAKPVGAFGFMREMAKRKIPFAKSKQEWENRRIDEKQLAQAFLEKCRRKYEKLEPRKQKQKIVSLLAGRGFSPETVWGILDGAR